MNESKRGKWDVRRVTSWVLRILLAGLFVMAGLGNLLGPEGVTLRFEEWGYPGEFRYVVAAIEIMGGLGLLVSRFLRPVVLVLCIHMFGALSTHLLNNELHRAPINVAIAVALLTTVWLSRRQKKAGSWSELLTSFIHQGPDL